MLRIIFAAVSLILTVVLWFVGKNERSVMAQLSEKGVVAQATVTRKEVKHQHKRADDHYFDLAWRTPNGQTYTGRKSVSRSLFDRIPTSQNVEIKYLPSEPTTFRLTGESSSPMVLFILSGVFAVIGVGCLLFPLFRKKSEPVA
jgi:hypothetical protein